MGSPRGNARRAHGRVMQIFRDGNLPPSVLAFLVDDGKDVAVIVNEHQAITDGDRVRKCINGLLAERDDEPHTLGLAI